MNGAKPIFAAKFYSMHYLKWCLFSTLILLSSCKPSGQTQQNHLANESSPYLLQHANNPVDWYPWGEEALKKAETEEKMILVSIGYAACHWCHVMEHESFEDTTVSRIMNENFVCIKVDREERPDIDDVYMTACHLATGKSCGWPLNAFALPDGRPVWAGTYFPKKNWMEVMEYFIKLRQEEPAKLEEYASSLTSDIKNRERITINVGDQSFTQDVLDDILVNFLNGIDKKQGGRQGAPKFPMPNNYEFLLSYAHLHDHQEAMDAVKITLDKMALGGIYDQLGGGFARYSVDDKWLVPHFEKMLYDNGQLVSLYSQAYKVTKSPLYKKTIEETLAFIERELMDKEGGFYSSLDADSEGEEGKFYVWTKEEIESAIGNEAHSKIFEDYFEISARGNWEEEKNILHRKKTEEAIAKKHDISVAELQEIINGAKAKLMKVRDQRIRPGLDDKVLTSWNALMLKGYCDAYQALGREAYLNTAIKNGEFLLRAMKKDDHRLDRNYKNGKSTINAFLDDYALTIDAFISLYQITFDEKWLNHANDLAVYVQAHFFDAQSGMFNYTSDLDPPLIARKMEISDNVIPSSNSAMARALFHLGTFLYQPDYIATARQMMQNIAPQIEEHPQPNFFSNWCQLYRELVNPPYEVAIMGDNYVQLRNDLAKNYLPNVLLLGGSQEGSLELLKDKLQEGMNMIYVCQNKVCKMPVSEVDKALTLID